MVDKKDNRHHKRYRSPEKAKTGSIEQREESLRTYRFLFSDQMLKIAMAQNIEIMFIEDLDAGEREPQRPE